MKRKPDPGDIQNASLLTNIFGGWPSFHDAEILSMRLERATGQPFLEVQIYFFRMTDSVDDHGYLILRDHTLATIRFDDIDEIEITDFNHQNVIFGIEIVRRETNGRRFAVEWQGSNGCDARFSCGRISVLEVVPAQTPASATGKADAGRADTKTAIQTDE